MISIDFAKDLVTIGTWAIHLSTFMIWLSAMLAFFMNLIVNHRHYTSMSKKEMLKELAKDAFHAAEEVAKITPMESDDKFLLYLKKSIKAYTAVYKRKPTTKELLYLKSKAEAYASKDKAYRLKQLEIANIIQAPVSKGELH